MMHSEKTIPVDELKKEKIRLMQEILRLREALKVEVDGDLGEGDPEMTEREQVAVLIRSHERKLEEIDHALQQAQAGSYGVCERCGRPIDPERLAILPEATLCVPCKAALEQQRR